MAARSYTRPTHDEIRQQERARWRALEGIRQEFGLDTSWVDHHYNAGSDPEEQRAERVRLAAEQDRRRRLDAIEPDPAGPLAGPAAVELMVRHFFARDDVANTLTVPEGERVQFVGEPREAAARVAGVLPRGGAANCADIFDRLAVGEGWSTSLNHIELAAGAATRNQLSYATRTGLDAVVRHDWARSGSWWRTAVRTVPTGDLRLRRFHIAISGATTAQRVTEGAAIERAANAGGSGWAMADAQVRVKRAETVVSYERAVNVGGVDVGQFINGEVDLWHDELDRKVGALLGGSKVRTVTGSALGSAQK